LSSVIRKIIAGHCDDDDDDDDYDLVDDYKGAGIAESAQSLSFRRKDLIRWIL
jgi:hypothetical protein